MVSLAYKQVKKTAIKPVSHSSKSQLGNGTHISLQRFELLNSTV